jgi:hypothetical protein
MTNRRERRQKKLNRALDGTQRDHAKYVRTYRHHVMRVVRDIEQGTVSIEDLAKLRNFCQMAVTLMEQAPLTLIQAAWRDTEILAFVHEDDEDTSVVLKGALPEYAKEICADDVSSSK